MGKPLQRDRIYSLKIGDAEDAIEINQLQIKFESQLPIKKTIRELE